MENGNWQSWAAIAVVALTVIIFVIRHFRKQNKAAASGCGHDCGCGPKLNADKIRAQKR